MKKLFLRLVLLSAMVGSLVLVPTSQTKSSGLSACPWGTYSCCSCYAEYQACLESCPGPGESGHFICKANCNNEQNWCTGFCDSTCYDCL
jgi:hypothetical protein